MATGMVESAAMQAAFEFCLKQIWERGEHAYDIYEGSSIEELRKTVNGCSPGIDKMYELSINSPSKEWVRNLNQMFTEAKSLVNDSGETSIIEKFGEARKAQTLQEDINKFMQNVVMVNVALGQIKLQISSMHMEDSLSELHQIILNLFLNQNILHEDLKDTIQKLMEEQTIQISEQDYLCRPPHKPEYLVGLDQHVGELKELVLELGNDVVGITAIGGAGKSTLATVLCHHPEIQEYFRESIIYIEVSESPDLLTILTTMWRKIIPRREPQFGNVKDAHNKLASQIRLSRNEPILVILDDIWQSSDLNEVLFKGEKYKTIVTSRDKKIIQSIPSWFNQAHYPLPPLQEEHALQLFCLCAFGMSTIPNTHSKELVNKVQAHCKGLPLTLQLIASSLKGQNHFRWKATRDALARGEISDDIHKNALLKRLETSINVLKPVEKQCFLDLAVFPKGRIIPANVLLDIWVYVRRMEREQAVLLLLTFEDRHLLDLKRDPWTPESRDDCMNSYSISQHDVIRQLARYLAEQDNELHFSRLYMPQKQSDLPEEWQTDGDHFSRAQIVSIHTGAIQDTQWPEMEFPVAEALVLYFTAGEYCIPTFLHTMKRLKVLIIHNDNAKRAKLSGLAGFQILSQLKSLHLERLIVPPLHDNCKALKSLQKISLSLCEGLGKDKMFNLPALLEFNVDHCRDLEELSAGICSSKLLEILSITHCHNLAKLPDNLDKLGSLKEIRLSQSPGLKTLPPSISSIKNLELLNISSCMGLKENRRKDPELKKTFQSLAQMASLKSVICDEDIEQVFRRSSKPDLEVVAVVEDFNLNWLFWGTD